MFLNRDDDFEAYLQHLLVVSIIFLFNTCLVLYVDKYGDNLLREKFENWQSVAASCSQSYLQNEYEWMKNQVSESSKLIQSEEENEYYDKEML
jgi:hypothetical protein